MKKYMLYNIFTSVEGAVKYNEFLQRRVGLPFAVIEIDEKDLQKIEMRGKKIDG